MSDNFNSLYIAKMEAWDRFNKAVHFATKCKIAQDLRGFEFEDSKAFNFDSTENSRFFYKEFSSMIHAAGVPIPCEYSGFVIQSENDPNSFHVFFIDEDSIPINAAFDVDVDDVLGVFEGMLQTRRDNFNSPLKESYYKVNEDGIMYRN